MRRPVTMAFQTIDHFANLHSLFALFLVHLYPLARLRITIMPTPPGTINPPPTTTAQSLHLRPIRAGPRTQKQPE